jgi:hypothetical protein
MKLMNKAGLKAAAESVEQRAGTEGNADQQWPAHETFAVRGRAGRGPFTRTGHGQLSASSESIICYLTFASFALALTAATADGSAKAMTASPSSKL